MVFAVNPPLPSSQEFISQVNTLAFPQIFAYSSAIIGILVVVLLIKSFVK